MIVKFCLKRIISANDAYLGVSMQPVVNPSSKLPSVDIEICSSVLTPASLSRGSWWRLFPGLFNSFNYIIFVGKSLFIDGSKGKLGNLSIKPTVGTVIMFYLGRF